MIVSLNWLKDYVTLPVSAEELADRLTMAGLEVEEVRRSNPALHGVVSARLEAIEPHPRSDHLHLCRVSDGRKTYRVVCGAPDLQEGSVVPLALPGARLADGNTLQETAIRGEVSEGMLCSQAELGLGQDAGGIWTLPQNAPIGMPLSELLDVQDIVLDVSITPNRGDCLSILGIAREASALCNAPLRIPHISLPETGPAVETLSSVTIDDPVGCPRYAARIIQGITIGPSPDWLRERMETVGLRSINNIVDVTNYVMWELGQPLHAFDFDRLREHRIVVRRASEGERFTTLDGVERLLSDDTLLICDGLGPVAIAGVMGGLDSEISPETTQVLIESAYFEPQCIRRTSKKLGLRTESSYRFERGIDPEGVIRALDRAAQLMGEVGGGAIATGRIDVYPNPIEPLHITLRVDRTNRFLGTQLEASEMADLLRKIGIQVEALDGDRLQVVPPSFRPDLTREVDLAEEVIRLAGYDRVPVTSPAARVDAAPLDPHLRARQETKRVLQAAGFDEVINYSFISLAALNKLNLEPDDPRLCPVAIKNPLSEEQAVMRTSLVPGLLQTARTNFDHRNDDLRLFELSKVFLPREGEVLPEEPHQLAGVLAGRRSPDLLYGGEAQVDYTDVKGVVEEVLDLFHPGKVEFRWEDLPPYLDAGCAASVFIEGQRVGALGQVDPRVDEAFDFKRPVFFFELDFDRLFVLGRPHPSFRPLPKFPPVVRDMALVVDEGLIAQDVVEFVWSRREPLLERVDIFDIYRNPQLGEGKKSVGYRLLYRAADRSLTDEEVNTIHERLVAAVTQTFHASLR